MLRTLVFMVLIGGIVCLAGCPIGTCSYDKGEGEEGTVSIVSVVPEQQGETSYTLVGVDGLFKTTFQLETAEYERCVANLGYAVGATMPGAIIYGGACPPKYRLGDCAAYGW